MATVTVNSKTFEVAKPRLRWQDVVLMAGKRSTNLLSMTVTLPEGTPKPFIFGHSLIVVDGMTMTVS